MIDQKRLRRRDFLAGAATTLAPLIVSGNSVHAARTSDNRKRAIRVAHLTDTHIQPERGAKAGVALALQHLHALDDPPELILTGGDSIMDSFEANDGRTELQWQLWNQVFREECGIPVKSCIGNHDIWGWSKSSSGTTGSEPGWGKGRAIDQLRLPNRFYSFDRAGWHFVALDSVRQNPDNPNGYLAFLDEEQFEWLKGDLAHHSAAPVLLFSHIPIFTVTILTHGRVTNNQQVISGGSMHLDGARLKDLFSLHPNVKLCLSGHIHLVDHVSYSGVTYCCNGAVCGNWWKGDHKECDEGYALIDLYDDGSFATQYVAYGWEPRE